MEKPSNETLNVLIKDVKSDTFEIKEHLKTLNKSVTKLNKFKIETNTYLKIIGFIMTVILFPLALLYLKKQFGL